MELQLEGSLKVTVHSRSNDRMIDPRSIDNWQLTAVSPDLVFPKSYVRSSFSSSTSLYIISESFRKYKTLTYKGTKINTDRLK